MKNEFNVIFEPGDNGWWIARAVEIPGGISQGRTIEEARENVIDAVRELILARRQLMESELIDQPNAVREQLAVEV